MDYLELDSQRKEVVMKHIPHFGTQAEIKFSLDKAMRLLGENGFLHFPAAPLYKARNGFVAFAPKPNRILYAEIVLLRSRGSFLELRADSKPFDSSTLALLRKYLRVAIRLGPILPSVTDTSEYVHPEHREHYKNILTQARL